MLRSQQTHFPEGQFVVEYEGNIVGYCATFRIDEAVALAPHTWMQITGGGMGSRHKPDGDWLYGMEVVVHPDYRGMRIGQRLYQARKRLCIDSEAARHRVRRTHSRPGQEHAALRHAEAYVQAVVEGKRRDPTLSFQLAMISRRSACCALTCRRTTIRSAMPCTWSGAIRAARSAGHAVDPLDAQPARFGTRGNGAVQQRRIKSFEEFATQVEYFTDIAADYNADFVTFPEMITLQLLSIENEELSPVDTIRKLSHYTPQVKELFSHLAVHYNINIIAGSHPTEQANGDIHNVCYVCLRDGSIARAREAASHAQRAHHVWNITGGDTAATVQTDCGPIGVMICYDSEFPEVARHLTDQGALILFVPFCTDVREGYLRVRYCSQARAIENQCYVVLSGNVGNLPGVNNFDIQYGQSCILTPSDFPFARDGIAADSTPNIETVLFADLRLESLAMRAQCRRGAEPEGSALRPLRDAG
jgi:predicted amidohydrolase/GNAT superfamily N-acetyltransferase